VPEIIVDAGTPVCCTDDVFVVFPGSNVRQSEAEDFGVGEDWIMSASASAGRTQPVTSIHLLTPPSSRRCFEEPRSSWYIECGSGNDNTEFLDCPSFSTPGDDVAAAASQLENTSTCIGEIGHSVTDEKCVKDSASAAGDGAAKDSDGLRNGSGVELATPVDVKLANRADYDHVSDRRKSADRNVEVGTDSRSTDDNVLDFEREDSAENRDSVELDDDKRSSVRLKAASHSRFVTSLYMVLASDLSCCQTSPCSVNDHAIAVDVSNPCMPVENCL